MFTANFQNAFEEQYFGARMDGQTIFCSSYMLKNPKREDKLLSEHPGSDELITG
jgi:hypothetical protein